MNARVLILLLLVAVPARAAPYLVAYEANTPGVFPEDVGWQRFVYGDGAIRTVENGIFTLQAANPAPNGGTDSYLFDMAEQMDPDPGEFFFAEWRMRLLPGSDSSDVGILIAPDGMVRDFDLFYNVAGLWASRDAHRFELDTTVFHTYRLESPDMVDYQMFIDGQWVWDGFFGLGTTRTSEVLWGDGLIGRASGSQWDYFRFGVVTVPAPPGVVLLGAGLFLAIWTNKR